MQQNYTKYKTTQEAQHNDDEEVRCCGEGGSSFAYGRKRKEAFREEVGNSLVAFLPCRRKGNGGMKTPLTPKKRKYQLSTEKKKREKKEGKRIGQHTKKYLKLYEGRAM